MPQYIALLGKSSQLAAAELNTVLGRFQASISEFIPPYLVSINGEIDPQIVLPLTGGTVKIYELISSTSQEPAEIIFQEIIKTAKTHFCLSSLQSHLDLKTIAQEIKENLAKQSIKPHFRLLDDPFISAGVVNKYDEYLISTVHKDTHILRAVSVQNLNYWSKKDYGRPAFDPSSGMLPPKVARTMLNLALLSHPKPDFTVYDPMCGSGTIIMEAIDLGLKPIGSDLAHKAVTDSQTNTDWFCQRFDKPNLAHVFQADATHVTLADIQDPVDAIVFEGYLGPPSPSYQAVDNLIKGLSKLYRGVFKNLYPLLKPNGMLVCALPEYCLPSGVKTLDDLVDSISSLGYTQLNRFSYGRHQAFVKRAIYVLQKKLK